jgi:hypothetical protein
MSAISKIALTRLNDKIGLGNPYKRMRATFLQEKINHAARKNTINDYQLQVLSHTLI